MSKQKPIEIITPPNALKAKIGGALPAIDPQAVARAEAALAKLSDQFTDWIAEELDKLVEAWEAFESAPSEKNRREVHRRSHDLKGLAPTYGYPLTGRIASSLCKLTGDEADGIDVPRALLKAHVDGVRATIRRKIMTNDHPVGVALATELENQMLALIPRSS